jgi:site-specific DNA-methyltransferase (adenine-specific)
MNLIQGDCLKKLKDISNNSVDCFICDLPYAITEIKWDNKIDLQELWREMKRIATNDTTPYFFFCNMKLAVDLINSNSKMFRYDLVWRKTNSTCNHLNSGKMPMKNHELLLVFYKKLPTYNKTIYHKKLITEEHYGEKHKTDNSVYGKRHKQSKCARNEKRYDNPIPLSVLDFPIENKMSQHKRFHPTQKPQCILEWIIKYYTNEGDTILDPTMGSGSTGVACKTLNRNFIGIEMNEDYYNIAIERIGEI